MKQKLLFISACMAGFITANATDHEPGDGKKDEINGIITHAENKKPLKDVTVTAYRIAKKEKAIKTDKLGEFAFAELKPGTYKFVFEKSGFKRIIKK